MNPVWSTIVTAFNNLITLGEQLSPAINAWIISNIPAHKQREIDRRMRRCKRCCRHNQFNAELIAKQVSVDFVDLSDTQRGDIASLIDYELLKTKN